MTSLNLSYMKDRAKHKLNFWIFNDVVREILMARYLKSSYNSKVEFLDYNDDGLTLKSGGLHIFFNKKRLKKFENCLLFVFSRPLVVLLQKVYKKKLGRPKLE